MAKRRGAVAAGHPATAQTAAQVLAAGGNAFDAALAALATACVVEPVLASLGGGGFLLAGLPNARSRLYDFFVHTPLCKRAPEELEFYPVEADFGTARQEFHIGRASIATPGVVKGIFEIHRELCRMPLREILLPAIELAKTGVPVSAFQALLFSVVAPIYSATASAQQLFGNPKNLSQPIEEGTNFPNPDLAALLDILSYEGEALFYRGEVARLMIEDLGDAGHLSLQDFATYSVIRRVPLQVTYRSAELWTNPAPASGGLLTGFALKLLNSWPPQVYGSYDALRSIAQVLEASNLARQNADMDTAFSAEQANQLLADTVIEQYLRVAQHPPAHRGTTHISVLDTAGNAAALTVSNGEGCGRVMPGTGTMLNNMLGEQDLNPHGWHRWRENLRMTSMMAPMLMRQESQQVVMGSGGSNRIRSALLQVLVNLLDHKQSLAAAIRQPRIHYEDGVLQLEPGYLPSELEKLCAQYPNHKLWPDLNLFFGGVHAVAINSKTEFTAVGDPRRDGSAVVV